MKRIMAAAALIAALALSGCGDPPKQGHGVYMLIDTSGTYTEELDKAAQIISFVLSRMNPGDSFAVARIDTGSFSEKDIIARTTFDERPSVANRQKRQFQEDIAEFVRTVTPARHTDITGGILQATEYLNEKDPGQKTILVFSDLAEDLDPEYRAGRDAITFDIIDYEVVALNVTKLRSDNIDPREYLLRLEDWQRRVELGGGQWRVINDLDALERILG